MSDQMTETTTTPATGKGGAPYFGAIVVIGLAAVIGAGVAFKKSGDLKAEVSSLRTKLRALEGKTIAPTEEMVPAAQLKDREVEIERLTKELSEAKGKTSQTGDDRSKLANMTNGLERQVERLESDVLTRDRQIEEMEGQLKKAEERKPEEAKKPEEKKPEAPAPEKPGGK